jgi:hypothetical protein
MLTEQGSNRTNFDVVIEIVLEDVFDILRGEDADNSRLTEHFELKWLTELLCLFEELQSVLGVGSMRDNRTSKMEKDS